MPVWVGYKTPKLAASFLNMYLKHGKCSSCHIKLVPGNS